MPMTSKEMIKLLEKNSFVYIKSGRIRKYENWQKYIFVVLQLCEKTYWSRKGSLHTQKSTWDGEYAVHPLSFYVESKKSKKNLTLFLDVDFYEDTVYNNNVQKPY